MLHWGAKARALEYVGVKGVGGEGGSAMRVRGG